MIHDLRDVRGRLVHLAVAAVVGIAGALAVTVSVPTRDHFPIPAGGCGFGHQDQGQLVTGGDPVLMLAGVVVIAAAAYAILRAIAAHRARRPPTAVARYL